MAPGSSCLGSKLGGGVVVVAEHAGDHGCGGLENESRRNRIYQAYRELGARDSHHRAPAVLVGTGTAGVDPGDDAQG